jgi:hypothetical protein
MTAVCSFPCRVCPGLWMLCHVQWYLPRKWTWTIKIQRKSPFVCKTASFEPTIGKVLVTFKGR